MAQTNRTNRTNKTNRKNSARLGFVFALALAVGLLAGFLPGSDAAAADKSAPAGIKDVPVKTYQVQDEEMTLQEDENYDTAYDPRSETWFQNAARVENQVDTELCWAFSATTAAELSWAKENAAGTQPTTCPQLSPVHLAYYYFNWPGDPLGGTDGDKNNLTVSDSWLDEGGNQIWVMQHMANQADLVLDDGPFKFTSENDIYTGPREFDADLCYGQNTLILEDSIFHSFTSQPASQKSIDTVKSMITEYGAVMGSIYMDDNNTYLNNDVSFYNPEKKSTNHAITIVGWDDEYPAGNFKPQGEEPKLPSSGAWLVQNSYGEQRNDHGYMWVSYESIDLWSQYLVALNMAAAPETDTDVFQYDGNSYCSLDEDCQEMDAGEIAANVFDAPNGCRIEKLERVGFTTFNNVSTDYLIQIYTGVEDPDQPNKGTLAAEQEVHTDEPGYHTFQLDKPVTIRSEDTFSVCITFKQDACVGVEKSDESGDFTAALAPKQSYYLFKEDGEWYDASGGQTIECFRIKAMATPQIWPDHDWKVVKTIAPAKGVPGYTIYHCSQCGNDGTGSETPALKPVPNKTSLTKLTPAKKAMTVKWKKSTEKIAGKNIDGYQIRYSLKKTMKSAKTVTVKGYNVSSKKVKKLKAKKKYFVQIRTFKKTDGKMYYSGWSAKKAVKVK